MKIPNAFENGHEYTYEEGDELFYRIENKKKIYLIKLIDGSGKEIFYESSDIDFSKWVFFYFSSKRNFGSPPNLERMKMNLWVQ